MSSAAALLLPLASSVVYVLAALLMKRSSTFGLGIWRTTFVANITMGVVFAPLWFLGGPEPDWTLVWQPLLGAALFVLGQIATFLALERGDVSVTTPVLGLKILLVAFFTVLLVGEQLRWPLWTAAALSTVAVMLLNRGDSQRRQQSQATAVVAAMVAATSYACCDVLIQKWSKTWGAGHFAPLMFAFSALLSFALIPKFSAPLRRVPRAAWPWLLGGSAAFAVQSASLVYAIGTYGNATSANVVYSSRGLWSVLAVWKIGHWFANTEQHMSRAALRGRFAGAALMLVAIGLVLL